tara:strand:- start:29916 stop:30629 length:714 start_codon:yes stop_codon:yes gene_type:complete
MNLIPAIDILNGKCVRLKQGDYDKQTIFSDDPVEFAVKWSDAGADWIHIIDLDGARDGKLINNQSISNIINVTNCSIQTGGGIRTYTDFKQRIEMGVNRVIVSTAAINDIDLLQSLVSTFSEELIVSIDARNGLVQINGWKEETSLDAFDYVQELASLGVKRIIYTDIERDGTNAGVNFKNMEKIVNNSHIPIIAAGGISSIDDLRKLKSIGVEGAIIGRALFDGMIDLEEAINLIR